MTAPGRYCLRICYCGECAHYVPRKQAAGERKHIQPLKTNEGMAQSWKDRDEETWLDKQ